MKIRLVLSSFALCCLAPYAHGQSVGNASYENPGLSPGNYAYNPINDGIVFMEGAGIQSNSAAWGFGEAPDGVQSAFIQGRGGFSQSITGLTIGSIYNVSFFDAFRANTDLYLPNPYSVTFNNQVIGIFQPKANAFTLVATNSFFADSTAGTLTFRGLSPDSYDRAVAIDGVTVNSSVFAASAVPEPATWAMMLIGFGAVGHAIRRRPRVMCSVLLA